VKENSSLFAAVYQNSVYEALLRNMKRSLIARMKQSALSFLNTNTFFMVLKSTASLFMHS